MSFLIKAGIFTETLEVVSKRPCKWLTVFLYDILFYYKRVKNIAVKDLCLIPKNVFPNKKTEICKNFEIWPLAKSDPSEMVKFRLGAKSSLFKIIFSHVSEMFF